MRSERKSRFLSYLALVVGVLSISISFAAYSSSLIIVKINRNVNCELFKVYLSSEEETVKQGFLKANTFNGAKGNTAEISNAALGNLQINSTVANIHAYFTNPGQSVTYKLYAINSGKYSAYLKQVEFKNVYRTNKHKVCTAGKGASSILVDEACKDIKIRIKIRDTIFEDNENINKIYNVSDHLLAPGLSEPIIITISYENNDNNTVSDGPFYVDFGDIVLTYLSTDY